MNDAVNVEVDNSQVTAPVADTSTATNVEVDNSQVINNATPMDSNVTYDNLGPTETEPEIVNPEAVSIDNDVQPTPYNPDLDPAQNAITEAINRENTTALNNNAGQAMNNFINNEYDYDKNEAGTYWVAGAINDVDTQMSFLQTLINEDMYGEMDLQKYYYDTTMATARAYAAAKNREVAYNFYRAAQEKAIAEAQLTGWYMPAEGNYMLGQYTVAQTKVDDPNATAEEKARANRVIKTTEEWFNANQISTLGIKCLSRLQYEESVRHNTIMGELMQQAQKAANSAAGAGASAAKWSEKLRLFDIEEMELQYGVDFTDDNHLGHNRNNPDYKDYDLLTYTHGGSSIAEIANNPDTFTKLLGLRGQGWLESVLGKDYTSYKWQSDSDINKKEMNKDDFNMSKDIGKLQGNTYKSDIKTYKGNTTTGNVKEVITSDDGKTQARLFIEKSDGTWIQMDTIPKELEDKKGIQSISGIFTNSDTININGKNISFSTTKQELTDDIAYSLGYTQEQYTKLKTSKADLEKEGFKEFTGATYNAKFTGLLETNNKKYGIIMYNEKTGEYKAICTQNSDMINNNAGVGDVITVEKDKLTSLRNSATNNRIGTEVSGNDKTAIALQGEKYYSEDGKKVYIKYQTMQGKNSYVEYDLSNVQGEKNYINTKDTLLPVAGGIAGFMLGGGIPGAILGAVGARTISEGLKADSILAGAGKMTYISEDTFNKAVTGNTITQETNVPLGNTDNTTTPVLDVGQKTTSPSGSTNVNVGGGKTIDYNPGVPGTPNYQKRQVDSIATARGLGMYKDKSDDQLKMMYDKDPWEFMNKIFEVKEGGNKNGK